MKSLPKAPQHSSASIKLEAKFRGLVTGEPQRIVLWLQGHRSPAHNVLVRANRWQQHKLTGEAQQALLDARMSSLPSSGSGPSMPRPNLLP